MKPMLGSDGEFRRKWLLFAAAAVLLYLVLKVLASMRL